MPGGWIWFSPSKKYTLPSQTLVDTNKYSLREKVFSLLWGVPLVLRGSAGKSTKAFEDRKNTCMAFSGPDASFCDPAFWVGGSRHWGLQSKETGVAAESSAQGRSLPKLLGRAFGTCLGLNPLCTARSSCAGWAQCHCSASPGDRGRGGDERLQGPEGGVHGDHRVSCCSPAALPADPDHHRCREEFHHRLPPAHKHPAGPPRSEGIDRLGGASSGSAHVCDTEFPV